MWVLILVKMGNFNVKLTLNDSMSFFQEKFNFSMKNSPDTNIQDTGQE